MEGNDNESLEILVEFVSAMDLVPPHFDSKRSPDAYVVMKYSGYEGRAHTLHKTKPVRQQFDPIWTINEKSLYLLTVDKDAFEASGGLLFQVFSTEKNLITQHFCHGVTTVSWEDVSESHGQRLEFPLVVRYKENRSIKIKKKGILALRFRHATDEDKHFMAQYQPQYKPAVRRTLINVAPKSIRRIYHDGSPSDFTFRQEKPPQLHRRYFKVAQKSGKDMFYTRPYADPKNGKKTQWLSKQDIDSYCLEPSRKWFSAGGGTKGVVRVEVLSCHDLPNMDQGLDTHDLTDAFVAIAFEDVLVRTDVIHDVLSPRWMPWCNRAFEFNINHPSNLLFVGVFDYDLNPLTEHDPIGRVVIDLSNFETNTVYVVNYKLHLDQNHTCKHGTIKLRIKLNWKDERVALLKSFGNPPICYINVDNKKAFRVLRYLCKGEINLEKATMKSVKLYAQELFSYYDVLLLVIDHLIRIFLWRGRISVSIRRPRWIVQDERPETQQRLLMQEKVASTAEFLRFSFWLPIHSILLFKASIESVENPRHIPGILCFSISWIMFSIGIHKSHSPSPWDRCKSLSGITSILFLGRHVHLPVNIKENDGFDTKLQMERITEKRKQRIDAFLMSCKNVSLKFYRNHYKTDFRASLETKEKNFWLYEKWLYYIHIILRKYCHLLRIVKHVVSWHSSSKAYMIIVMSFLVGLFFMLFPWEKVVLWTLRITVWLFFGPWMKLYDIFYVMPHFKHIIDASEDDIKNPLDAEMIFNSPDMIKLAKLARISSEDALKLKTMRQYLYGEYSEVVPDYDSSRFSSIPLPDSTARTFKRSKSTYVENEEVIHIPGQRLRGRMIHTQHEDFDDDDSSDDDMQHMHSSTFKLKTLLTS